HWADEQQLDSSLWQKIAPKLTSGREKRKLVIKTFNSSDAPVPFEKVKASPHLDMWSFGVLLFQLLAKEPLFKVNRDEDLTNGDEMEKLLNWTQGAINTR